MIRFADVTVTYDGAVTPTLTGVDVTVPEGELVLVVGPTGSGKSTLLKTVNGLVPHFTGGTLHGRVVVADRDTALNPPRELADAVGYVAQDPQQGFVTDSVEDELAYTMESLAVAPDVMRRRVEDTLDLLGLTSLRHRPLRSLSGGERQRVAIGSVLTAHPRVLVLDEPTSALDPQAAEEVLAAVQRLVHDLGLTVVMSEHRLERVVQYADRVLLLRPGGQVVDYPDPAEAMAVSPLAPAVVDLGRLAGWQPLPLSIRDARRHAAGLREQLADAAPPPAPPPSAAAAVAQVDGVTAGYRDVSVLREVSVQVQPRDIVAVMGRNGAGKSTLLSLIAGQQAPQRGTVRVAGHDPTGLQGPGLIRTVGFVPQEPGDLLWSESVGQECRAADVDAGAPPGTTWTLFHDLRPDVAEATHPGDLSEGTRLTLALAVMLAGDPQVLLLDEPTRGLDYCAKEQLAQLLRRRAEKGRAVVIATHDVELVAQVCTRMVMLADGDVVLDTDSRSGAVSSPAFAPQVAKVMAPVPLLTVAEVRDVLPQEVPS